MDCLDRLRKNIDSPIEFRFISWRSFTSIDRYTETDFFKNLENNRHFKFLLEPKYFSLVYAIQALISYGGEIYDHFFRPKPGSSGCFIEFLKAVLNNFEKDCKANPDTSKFLIALKS